MRTAWGILLIWLGAACLYLAQIDIQTPTVWGAYRELLKGMGGE